MNRESYAGQLCLSKALESEAIKLTNSLISTRKNIYQILRRSTSRWYEDGIAMSLNSIRLEVTRLYRDLIKQTCKRDAAVAKCSTDNRVCLQQAKIKCINERKGTWIQEKYDNGWFLKK